MLLNMVRLVIDGQEALVFCKGSQPFYVRLKVDVENNYFSNCKSFDNRELLRLSGYDVFTEEEYYLHFGSPVKLTPTANFSLLRSSLSGRILCINHFDVIEAMDKNEAEN